MEIMGVSAFGQLPRTSVAERSVTSGQTLAAAEGSATGAQNGAPAATLRASEAARRDAPPPPETRQQAASEAAHVAGRIRFELEEGTGVTQFFDTKDVLIYQVPPEGRLLLVKSEQASAQDRLHTSA